MLITYLFSFKDRIEMLVLSLLMVVCSQLETAAQDDNITTASTPSLNTTSITDTTSEVSNFLFVSHHALMYFAD